MFSVHVFLLNSKIRTELRGSGNDVDKAVLEDAVVEFLHALFSEFDQAVLEGEQGEILASADIVACAIGVALLANKDIAGEHMLTRIQFNPKALSL